MDLDGLIKRLKFRFPLFRPTIFNLEFKVDNSIPTACTDGNEVLFSTKFMDSLNKDERLFVLAHELSHVALNHLKRRNDKDPYIWNIATDAVINAFLVRDGLKPPEGLVFIDGALSYSADELYKKLMSKEIPIPEGFEEAITKTTLEHSKWDSTSKEASSSKAGDEAGKPSEGDDSDDASGDKKEPDEREIFGKNQKLREEAERELKEEIQRGCSSLFDDTDIGESPYRGVSRVGKASNLVEWRNILKEGARLDLDYSFKDAQIEDGVLVSNLIEVPSTITEILVDTSGSIDEPLLRSFLRECKTVLQVSHLRIAFFDHRVYPFHDIKSAEDLDKIKIQGGGGTSFEAAAKAFSPDCDNKIVFTDGWSYIKNPPKDITWVVFNEYDSLPKSARKIRIDGERLRRSYRCE